MKEIKFITIKTYLRKIKLKFQTFCNRVISQKLFRKNFVLFTKQLFFLQLSSGIISFYGKKKVKIN